MKKKYLLLFIPFLSALIFGFLYLKSSVSFTEYSNELFKEEVAGDALSLHYTLANPEAYGISCGEISLPIFDFEQEKEHYASLENYHDSLKDFSHKKLNSEEAYAFTLLDKTLENDKKSSDFFFYQEVFSPSGGVQTQYPILMADYSFQAKEDIENYLALLSSTPEYFQSLVAFEKEKAKRGFAMADYSLDKVISQCKNFMSTKELDENSHFLQTTFEERIHSVLEQNKISSSDATSYIDENNAILRSSVLPAYQSLSQNLSSLKGSGKNEMGLYYFKEGREYYSYLFQEKTGSDVSVKDAYAALCKQYYQSLCTLNSLIKDFQIKNTLSDEELAAFPLDAPKDMIAHLQQIMKKDFPLQEEIVETISIKEVNPALQPHTAPAYYLLPPIDAYGTNTIYINPSSVPKGLSLYTTLAHEGYPGHLFQTTTFYHYMDNNKLPLTRCLFHYGGYVEGWALYTELLSFDYAKELFKDSPKKESYDLLLEIYKTERDAQLALLTLLDLGIHYYGLSIEQAANLLETYGITDSSQQRNIYEYIVEEPGNYPTYYWGYTEIKNLKNTAKQLWKEDYSDYNFHSFLLECGPSDFPSIAERLKSH